MTFDRNSYETPDKEAALMAKLVLPTDKKILEPFGGRGNLFDAIIKHLMNNQLTIPELYFNEIKKDRYDCFVRKYSDNDTLRKKLICTRSNYFSIESFVSAKFDLIITNPPFDSAMEGIKRSLVALNNKPESRLLFLLPLPFFSSQKRSKEFNDLDCHIAGITLITWRIDYLKDGVPMSKCQKEIDGVKQTKNGKPVMCSGRQESDAVFCIKKGKNPNSPINFL